MLKLYSSTRWHWHRNLGSWIRNRSHRRSSKSRVQGQSSQRRTVYQCRPLVLEPTSQLLRRDRFMDRSCTGCTRRPGRLAIGNSDLTGLCLLAAFLCQRHSLTLGPGGGEMGQRQGLPKLQSPHCLARTPPTEVAILGAKSRTDRVALSRF